LRWWVVAQVVELKHERAELQQTVQEVRTFVTLQLHGVAELLLVQAQTTQQLLKEKLEGLMLCNKDVVRENSRYASWPEEHWREGSQPVVQ
jgi:hypothetical protein